MVEREAFLMKPKNQCHLCQWVKQVYGVQSWKEKRLLHESLFVLIDRHSLILKNGGEKSFSYETKALMSFIPMRRHNYEKKRDDYVNPCLSQLTNELQL